jgi:hypothetical protein
MCADLTATIDFSALACRNGFRVRHHREGRVFKPSSIIAGIEVTRGNRPDRSGDD